MNKLTIALEIFLLALVIIPQIADVQGSRKARLIQDSQSSTMGRNIEVGRFVCTLVNHPETATDNSAVKGN